MASTGNTAIDKALGRTGTGSDTNTGTDTGSTPKRNPAIDKALNTQFTGSPGTRVTYESGGSVVTSEVPIAVIDTETGKTYTGADLQGVTLTTTKLSKQLEEQKRKAQSQYSGKERPAETAAELAMMADQRVLDEKGRPTNQYTAAALLAQQRQAELLAQAGAEARLTHTVEYKFKDKDKQGKEVTSKVYTRVGGVPKPEEPRTVKFENPFNESPATEREKAVSAVLAQTQSPTYNNLVYGDDYYKFGDTAKPYAGVLDKNIIAKRIDELGKKNKLQVWSAPSAFMDEEAGGARGLYRKQLPISNFKRLNPEVKDADHLIYYNEETSDFMKPEVKAHELGHFLAHIKKIGLPKNPKAKLETLHMYDNLNKKGGQRYGEYLADFLAAYQLEPEYMASKYPGMTKYYSEQLGLSPEKIMIKPVSLEQPQQKPQQKEDKKSSVADYNYRLNKYIGKVEALKAEEDKYFGGELFQDLSKVGSFLTFGGGKPVEQRSYWGQASEKIVTGVLSSPYAIPGLILYKGKAVMLAAEGLQYKETRQNILEELNPVPRIEVNLPAINKNTQGDIVLESKKYVLNEGTGAGGRAFETYFNPKNPEAVGTYGLTFVGGFFEVIGAARGKAVPKAETIKAQEIISRAVKDKTITIMEGVNRVNIGKKTYEFYVTAKEVSKTVSPNVQDVVAKVGYTGGEVSKTSAGKAARAEQTIAVKQDLVSSAKKYTGIELPNTKSGAEVIGNFLGKFKGDKQGYINAVEDLFKYKIQEDRFKFKYPKEISGRQVSAGKVITSADKSSKGLVNFVSSLRIGKNSFVQKGKTKTSSYQITTEPEITGMVGVTKSSPMIKLKTKNKARLKQQLSKQTPSSIEAGLIKEVAKIDDETFYQAKFGELQSKKEATAFVKELSNINKGELQETRAGAVKKGIIKGSQELLQTLKQESNLKTNLGIQTRQAVTQAAKQSYTQKYVEPIQKAAVITKATALESALRKQKQSAAKVDIAQTTQQRSATISKNIQSPISVSFVETRQTQQPIQLSEQNINTRQIQEPINITKQAQETRQLQEQIQISKTKHQSRARGVRVGITTKPIVPQFALPSGKIKRKRKSIFTPQIRRKGKFINIAGRFETPQQAEAAAKLKVESTLGASGRVIEYETGKPITSSVVPAGFYKSRKEAGVIIQQRGKRLSTFAERREIQGAKAMASRIKNIFGGK